jgi:hypothetical protein
MPPNLWCETAHWLQFSSGVVGIVAALIWARAYLYRASTERQNELNALAALTTAVAVLLQFVTALGPSCWSGRHG